MTIDAEQQPDLRKRLNALLEYVSIHDEHAATVRNALDAICVTADPMFVPADGQLLPYHQPYTAADEDGLYVLLRSFRVELPGGDVLAVDRGILKKIDGISIPKRYWSWVGVRPGGRCRLAATVHDFLYKFNGLVQVIRDGERVWRKFTKHECDWIFHWLMARASTRRPYRIRSWVCYAGVLSPGGWVAWYRHTLRNRKSRYWKATLILAEDDMRPPVWSAHAKRIWEAADGGDA